MWRRETITANPLYSSNLQGVDIATPCLSTPQNINSTTLEDIRPAFTHMSSSEFQFEHHVTALPFLVRICYFSQQTAMLFLFLYLDQYGPPSEIKKQIGKQNVKKGKKGGKID